MSSCVILPLLVLFFFSFFFFFFQAEDGIRDLTVTGVQTCALPISHIDRRQARPVRRRRDGGRCEQGGLPTDWAIMHYGDDRGRRCRRAGCDRAVGEIGRASCRERGEMAVGGGDVQNKREKSHERSW